MPVLPTAQLLAPADWRARACAHRSRVDDLVGPYLQNRRAGEKHPVIDFLFTYYGHKPAQLKRWHPGYGVVLAEAAEYAEWRGYHQVPGDSEVTTEVIPAWTADPEFLKKRRNTIEFVSELLSATTARPAQLSCFGLHEWAMVYRSDDVRHQQVPLRLGREGTDAVVDSMQLRCTHYDAFRFFTPDAIPLNIEPLTRDDQIRREQPGCLHANMDLYKWGFKLVPLIDSALLLECFELACAARELDMKASPYDLSDYDYEPVRIETPSGRAEYVRRQAEIATRSEALRARLLQACHALLAAGR